MYVDYFILTKEQVRDGIMKCFSNIEKLIESVYIMSMNTNENPITIGLFSFAIEEYGKVLILKEELDKGELSIKIPKILFRGRDSHKLKFGKALSVLPDDAKNFSEKYAIEWIKFPESKIVDGKLVKKVTEIMEGGEDLPTTFEARMDCFYIDWDSINSTWKENPKHLFFHFFSVTEKFQDHIKEKKKEWGFDS